MRKHRGKAKEASHHYKFSKSSRFEHAFNRTEDFESFEKNTTGGEECFDQEVTSNNFKKPYNSVTLAVVWVRGEGSEAYC